MKINMKTHMLLAAVILMATLPFHLPAQSAQMQVLRGHIPRAIAQHHLRPLGRLASTNELHLAISLPLRNAQALDELIRQIYDPANPNYRHYLTPEQFTEQFGPTRENYEKVASFMNAHGLKVTYRHSNRLVLDVSGSVQNIEKTFHIIMQTYRHPRENRTFYAPDTEPSLALTVPILHVAGLNNYSLPRPMSIVKPLAQGRSVTPNAGSGPGGTYMGKDFRAAYAPDTTLTGAGQVVGLLQYDGYNLNDILCYEQSNGLPNVTLTNVVLDGEGNPTGLGGEVEVSLDIEMALSMAPSLSKIIVYEGVSGFFGSTPWVDFLSRMADDDVAKQISCSWGESSPGDIHSDEEQLFKQMAVQGQSFFAASGDSDAYTNGIPFPAESTNVTVVGGTTLSTGAGASYSSETVWNWGYVCNDNGCGWVGSSGGISTNFSIPYWQQGINMAANQGSTTMRNVPDVSLTADNVYVRADGTNFSVGGTSCAAPLWAGFAALINQQAQDSGNSPVGFLNPAIYAIGKGPHYQEDFHDITSGDNTWSNITEFYAVPGYDLCTGWGTPAGQSLINDLSGPGDPLHVTPFMGFDAMGFAGGPFNTNSEIFTLTNSSASSLNWYAGNLPSWLNVSSVSGTLAAHNTATITVSLNSGATSLPAGWYKASVSFTNLADQVILSRQFSLAVFGAPAGQSVVPGGTAVLSATVPAGPFTCQWQFNGTNLPDKIITTVAGGGYDSSPFYNGLATNGALSAPSAVAVDGGGNFYIADTSYKVVRKVDPDGNMTTVAGGGNDTTPFYNGPATGAALTYLSGLAADKTGNLYIADFGVYSTGYSLVRKVDPNGNMTTVAGGGASGDINYSGSATNDFLRLLGEVAVDNTGNLYIADSMSDPGPNCVHEVSPNGWMSTVAGGGADSSVWYSGPATNVSLGPGGGLAVDGAGNLFLGNVGSFDPGAIRKVDNTGYMTPAVAAFGCNLVTVAADDHGDLFFTTSYTGGYIPYSYVIDRMDANGNITIVAGGGNDPSAFYSGPADGVGLQLWGPSGLAVDGNGDLFIADTENNVVRKVQLFASYPTLTLQNVTTANEGDYTVVITGPHGSITNSVPATLIVGTPPVITSQPQPASQTVVEGANVTFSVGAVGTSLTYQWRLNGNNIPDETSSTLVLADVQVADSGNYSVLVSNRAGSVTSDNVLLTVEAPPVITGQPTGLTYHIGDQTPLFFTVQASGSSLQYEWYCNGVPCADQYYWSSGWTESTSPTSVFIPNEYFAGTNWVTVRVYNDVGQAWSTPVAVIVYFPPQISLSPACMTALAGGDVNFSATVMGAAPLQYQWFLNGVSIPGATSTNLTLPNVQPSQSGQYTVQVSDFGGTAQAAVNLTIGNSTVVGWGNNSYGQTSIPCGLVDVTAIAEGSAHSLAAKTDGTVVGWGYNYSGQAQPPSGLSNVVAVSAGNSHSLALKSNGTVVGWGDNTYGESTAPSGLTNVVAVSAGRLYSLALKTNGTVVAWGTGLTNVPASLTNAVAIAAGIFHALAVRADGSVVAWGNNNFGQTNVPANLTNAVAVACGFYHSLALRSDGTVVAWGNNNYGQTNIPANLTNVVAIACGYFHNLALTADGTVVAWGMDSYGQTNVPANLTNVVAIAAGGYSSLALINEGAPVIAVPPHMETVLDGGPAQFQVSALGKAPLHYQWRFNGANIVNATNATYSMASVVPGAAGNYSVVITNILGSTTSTPAALTVDNSIDRLNDAYSTWTSLGASFNPDPGWDAHFQAAILAAVLCSDGTNHQAMVTSYNWYFTDPTQGANSIGLENFMVGPTGRDICMAFGVPDGITAMPGLNRDSADGLHLATSNVNAFYKLGIYAYILSFNKNASPAFTVDFANPYLLPAYDPSIPGYPWTQFSPCSNY